MGKANENSLLKLCARICAGVPLLSKLNDNIIVGHSEMTNTKNMFINNGSK